MRSVTVVPAASLKERGLLAGDQCGHLGRFRLEIPLSRAKEMWYIRLRVRLQAGLALRAGIESREADLWSMQQRVFWLAVKERNRDRQTRDGEHLACRLAGAVGIGRPLSDIQLEGLEAAANSSAPRALPTGALFFHQDVDALSA
jgi:hypothetical protein